MSFFEEIKSLFCKDNQNKPKYRLVPAAADNLWYLEQLDPKYNIYMAVSLSITKEEAERRISSLERKPIYIDV